MYDPTRIPKPAPVRGRGASDNPPGRFLPIHVVPEERGGSDSPERDDRDAGARTTFLRDRSRSVISRNQSPDLPMGASFNPYRGCEHGCSYCYARPTHEYLGFSPGLDFETRIMVKEQAPALLRATFASRSWTPEPVMMSGATDAYQPIERKLELTRRCLAVFMEARNPVAIVTKNHLVTRDVDLLGELATVDAAAVILSVTTLDPALQRELEPRASTPLRRLDAIRTLAEAGIPVGVMVAPVIPGLTEAEIPSILRASREAGASFAQYVLLRLPHGVKEVFSGWVEERFPERASRILGRIRATRNGKLYDSSYSVRGRGEGPMADHIASLFRVSRSRTGLDGPAPELSTASFVRPSSPAIRASQMDLFG
jgi:DNA repair photolyase